MKFETLKGDILVIEDEFPIAELLRYTLEKSDFKVRTADNGEDGLTAIEEQLPDLAIIDWMLGDYSGIDIIRSLRASAETAQLPVIMLTAKGEEDDRLTGLNSGADDYMVKPFSPKELVARINALLRRTRPVLQEKRMEFEEILIDMNHYQASCEGRSLALGPTEFKLLAYLVEHPDRVFSREHLLNAVWGQDVYVEERTVDACIKRIRKAISSIKPTAENYIKTRRGAGYILTANM